MEPPKAGAYAAYLPHSLGGSGQCTLDGADIGCGFVNSLLSGGAAQQCTNNVCTARTRSFRDPDGKRNYIITTGFRAFANGAYGYFAPVFAPQDQADWLYNFSQALSVVEISDRQYGVDLTNSERASVQMAWTAFAPMPQSGRRDTFGPTRQARFDTENNLLMSQLKNKKSPCAEFLMKKLGLSSTRVARAVAGVRAFDGETSTISMGDAGLLPRSNINHFLLVASYFGWKKPDAMWAGFATPDDPGATHRDVYFGEKFDASTILHEALHLFTGMDDKALAKKLDVDISDGDTTKISQALKDGGCGH